MYPLDVVYLFIIAVAGLIIYTRLRPGALDVQLMRSRHDRMIAGVFGGLGARLGIAPLWLRLAWCAAFFFLEPVRFQLMSAYVVLWAITPRAPALSTPGAIDREVLDGEVTGADARPYESSYGTAPWRYRDTSLP